MPRIWRSARRDYRLAEDIETVRNCWLSEYYQTRLHICHVSTRGALDAIRMAKLRAHRLPVR